MREIDQRDCEWGQSDTEDAYKGKPSLPKMGDKSTCLDCGARIEFEGQHWRHIDSSPRHNARPVKFSRGI